MFIDKWEKENKENLEGLKFIDDGERKLFYRFSPAENNSKNAPLLVILHGHGVKKPTYFKHQSWNVLAPLDHFGYKNNGSWWLGENGDFFVKNLLQELIKQISLKYKCQNNIYFYGSSMGGYGAILHGILSGARAVYANVPQIQFSPSTYFKAFHKNAEAIFGNNALHFQENNLLTWLDAKSKFPVFYLCENIIEQQEHLKNYFKEHTLSFLNKCYKYQIKSHFEILPQEGHTKNYGLKEVLNKFEQFTPPLGGTDCMDVINLLDNGLVWYSNLGNFYKSSNKKLVINDLDKEKKVYIILGNKTIKQLKPSKNLINISNINKLNIDMVLTVVGNVEVSCFVQLFSEENLLESTKYKLKSGKNNLNIKEFHPSIVYMKLLFSFSSQGKEIYPILFEKLNLCIESYSEIKFPKNISNNYSLIPNVNHHILDKDMLLKKGQFTYEIIMDNIKLFFYLNYIEGEKLIVALPGATDRNKPFYNFQRYSWSQNISCSFMSLIDPTIKKENDLSIGWFQGQQNSYALEKLISFLKILFQKNNIDEKDVIFFGSSAGGFASLKLAEKFLVSMVIVINPQIYVYNYSRNAYEKLLKEVYKEEKRNIVKKRYKDRLEVRLNLENREAPIYYFQNIQDIHHLKKHLKPLLKTLKNFVYEEIDIDLNTSLNILKKVKKRLTILYYNDPESGHSPPNKEITLNILHTICKNEIK